MHTAPAENENQMRWDRAGWDGIEVGGGGHVTAQNTF